MGGSKLLKLRRIWFGDMCDLTDTMYLALTRRQNRRRELGLVPNSPSAQSAQYIWGA